MTMLKPDRPLTTFQVANLCGVFHTTVINWVNKGKLKAHHTPGGHRRIKLDDLLAFLREHGSPIPRELTEFTRKIVLVEDDPQTHKAVLRALKTLPDSDVKAFDNPLDALLDIGRDPPDLVVLGPGTPLASSQEVCRAIKGSPRSGKAKVIAFSRGESAASESERELQQSADYFLRKFSGEALKSKAAQLLSLG